METPLLEQLMGAYFNQDFGIIHGGSDETVDAFIEDHPASGPDLVLEIRATMAQYPSESALEDRLDRLGCEYFADAAEGGYLGWLTRIAQRVEQRGVQNSGHPQSSGD